MSKKNRVAVLWTACTSCLFANPQDPSIIRGNVTIGAKDQLLEITASDQSVIDWKQFSIQAGETTCFIQPDAKACVLNRVKGESPSLIDGMLQANGKVYLANPHGVIIGKEGVIKTAEFAAIAREITAIGGWEELFSCLDTIHFDLKEGQGVIRHDGLIQVTGCSVEGGRVLLLGSETHVQGRIEVPQGEAFILAEQVVLYPESVISVSGEQGGNVYIGGGVQGINPKLPCSKFVSFIQGAEVAADALEHGDGGVVVFWSETATSAQGSVSARGGEQSGDGGFVEISSRGHLDVRSAVDTRAPFGKMGEFLLDPSDITISTAATTDPFAPPYTYDPAGVAAANLNDADLASALDMSNVIVQTTSGVGGSGNIIVADGVNVTWTMNSSSLTLVANNSISFAPNTLGITFNGVGNINMVAQAGSVTIGVPAATSITDIVTTGNVDIQAQTGFAMHAPIDMSSYTRLASTSSTGSIDINVTNGDCLISSQALGGAFIGIDAMTNLPISGPVTITTPNGSMNIAVANAARYCLIGSLDRLHMLAHGDISWITGTNPAVGDQIGIYIDSSTGNPTRIESATGSIIWDGNLSQVQITLTNSDLQLQAPGNWTVDNSGVSGLHLFGITTDSDITANIGGNISLSDAGLPSILGFNSSDGNIHFTAGGDVSVAGDISGPILIAAFGPTSQTSITAGGSIAIGNTNPVAGNCVPVMGCCLPLAFFQGSAGLTLDAGGSITVNQGGRLLSGDSGFVFAKANQNISLLGNAIIDAFTAFQAGCGPLAPQDGFYVTLVVDDQAPNSPQIGNGQFVLAQNAQIITTGSAPVQIFTARRNQNIINGTINGSAFTPGTFGIDTPTEQWGVWYPDSFVGSPFTIFYKEGGTTLTQAVAAIIGETFDLFEEFAYPPPSYEDYFNILFCYQLTLGRFYKGANMVQAVPKLKKNWIQVDNYRKLYPSKNRYGFFAIDEEDAPVCP